METTRYSEYLQRRLEKDKNLYYRLLPPGSDDNNEDSKERKSYAANMRSCTSKDDFDEYKRLYRHVAKVNAMKEARHEIIRKMSIYKREPILADWSMVPYLHKRWCGAYGKTNLSVFLVILSIYYASSKMSIHWNGFQALCKTMVKMFTHDFTNYHWNAAVKYMTERSFVKAVISPDIHRRQFRSMASIHKSPGLRSVMKEDLYLLTTDGNRVGMNLMRYHVEFVDHSIGIVDAVRLSNAPDEMKNEIKAVKKYLFKKTGSKSRRQKNQARHAIRSIHIS